jgi:hypothetical protein
MLTRGNDGPFHALLNVFCHSGTEVRAKERGNTKMFVCPYHAWTYISDGSLRTTRLMPKDFNRNEYGLRKLHVQLASGMVFICFAEEPLDFGRSRMRCAPVAAIWLGQRQGRPSSVLPDRHKLEACRRELCRVRPLRPGPSRIFADTCIGKAARHDRRNECGDEGAPLQSRYRHHQRRPVANI